MQTSQTLRSSSPVLQNTSRCSQASLALSSVLSDSTRAFSGAPGSTCSYGGAFRMLQDLTSSIVTFWRRWDLCAGQQETSRVAETSTLVSGRLREQLRHLCSSVWDLVPHSYSSGAYSSITTRHFVYHVRLCYSQQICYIITLHVICKSVYTYT